MPDNKVQFGLKNVHIAPMEDDGTYGDIFALEGAVNLQLDAEGEESNFAADDNAKYFSRFTNNGYSGSLEVALINEDFFTKILGQIKDSNGVLSENVNDVVKKFALMFEVDGDVKKSRYVYYNVSVSRPSFEAATVEESIEPQTQTLDMTASQNANGFTRSKVEAGETAYDTFFTSVYTPTNVSL